MSWEEDVSVARSHRQTLTCHCGVAPPTEYYKIAVATSLGFLAMGVIGVTVKLVHLPINNILIGSS